jgi:hypothetical protein
MFETPPLAFAPLITTTNILGSSRQGVKIDCETSLKESSKQAATPEEKKLI